MALGTFVTSLRRRCVHSSQRLHYLGWNGIYSCSLCHKKVIGTKITNSERSWEGFKSNISWQRRKILDTSWPPPKPWSKPCHDYDHDQLTINHCQHFFSVHDVSTCQKVRGGPWVHGWCCLWGWGRHTPTRNSLCGLQKSLFLRNIYKDLKIHSKVTKHFQDQNEIRLCRSLFHFGTADNGWQNQWIDSMQYTTLFTFFLRFSLPQASHRSGHRRWMQAFPNHSLLSALLAPAG